jgi:hypothetical protein
VRAQWSHGPRDGCTTRIDRVSGIAEERTGRWVGPQLPQAQPRPAWPAMRFESPRPAHRPGSAPTANCWRTSLDSTARVIDRDICHADPRSPYRNRALSIKRGRRDHDANVAGQALPGRTGTLTLDGTGRRSDG